MELFHFTLKTILQVRLCIGVVYIFYGLIVEEKLIYFKSGMFRYNVNVEECELELKTTSTISLISDEGNFSQHKTSLIRY